MMSTCSRWTLTRLYLSAYRAFKHSVQPLCASSHREEMGWGTGVCGWFNAFETPQTHTNILLVSVRHISNKLMATSSEQFKFESKEDIVH